MSITQSLRMSLMLLPTKGRVRLMSLTIGQMLTSILDLLGVALLGIVIALGLSVQTGTPPPSFLDYLLTEAQLLGFSKIGFIAVLAAIAGTLLITKTAVSVVLTKKILRTLAFWQSEISTHLAKELLSQPVVVLRERSSQETSFALTNGVNAATLGVIGQASIGLSEIALLFVLTIGLLLFYPLLTLGIIVFLTGLAIVLQKSMSNWAGRVGSISGNADIESLRLIQESIRVYRELTVTGRRGNYVSRFSDTRVLAASVQADAHFISSIPKYVFEVALVVGAALLFTSQFLTTDLDSAVTATTVVLIASSRMIPSILRLQSAALGIRTSSAMATRTYVLAQDLRYKSQEPALGQNVKRRVTSSSSSESPLEIHLDQVTFTHRGNSLPSLTGVSVSIPVGTTLAVVGPTGSGKSTFADIILGICQPDSGTITIGGLPPYKAIEVWPGAFGYVPQEVVVVQGSVRANVTIGMTGEEISDSRVWKALEAAHLASFLIENRQGLDTLVGEDGVQLSGGQRQRLGIARALYNSPRVLVMDEATSALDAETEMAISQTLSSLDGEVSIIIVAHRLASVRQAHQVLYLEDGAAKAIGTFEEVREAIPRFNEQARLLGLQ